MAKYSDLLSTVGFDAASAQVAMSGDTPPVPKAEPARPGQYSYMSDDVAKALTPETREALDRQEAGLRGRRQSIEQGEENAFDALAQGAIAKEEFERRMGIVDFARTNPDVGLPAQEARVQQTQAAATRLVGVVTEMSDRMGVEQPQVDMPLFGDPVPKGGIEADNRGNERRLVRIPQQSVQVLDNDGLRFMAGHEIAHTADPHAVQGHSAEFRADAKAIRETCDVPAAVQALTTLARIGEAPLTTTDTHPSLEARASNMQGVHDSECRGPSHTLAKPAGRSGQER